MRKTLLSSLIAAICLAGCKSVSLDIDNPTDNTDNTPHAELIIEEMTTGLCQYDGQVDDKHLGFNGIGFIDAVNQVGTQISWQVELKQADDYIFTARFATGSSRSGKLTVTNLASGAEQSATYQFSSTTDWDNWQQESQQLTLGKGLYSIVLTAETDAGLPNIDSLTIKGGDIVANACDVHSGPLLNQQGNPVYGELDNYQDWLADQGSEQEKISDDKQIADNILTWQMPHGGFYKYGISKYQSPWNGSEARSGWVGNGIELGTIDNDATVSEILFLADVYQRTGDIKYRDGARAAVDFLLTMQTSTGGWPQVYPARGGSSYSDHVTFNDDAMARVLILLDKAQRQEAPLNNDLLTSSQIEQVDLAIKQGVNFILKAQIVQDGKLTVWCAQHGVDDYLPKPARSYELASKSGKESVLVAAFLMTRPQSDAVEMAVKSALAWYKDPQVQVADTTYISRPKSSSDDNYNPIQTQAGSIMWYRFYDVDANTGFFSGRSASDNPPGAGKVYDIMQVEPERRYGYQWGGNYGTKLINYANSVGYY